LLLGCSQLLSAQTPVTTLCDTGLTAAAPLPDGCTTSVLASPVNPPNGGPTVDGNWELAIPYAAAGPNDQAPNPCKASAFEAAAVDAPNLNYFNPADGISQWIMPKSAESGPDGWYIYRTTFTLPPLQPVTGRHMLSVTGQIMSDNTPAAIFLSNTAEDLECRLVALIPSWYNNWYTFSFSAAALTSSKMHLFVVLLNVPNPGLPNPTALRVRFGSAEIQ
jgi:hypothetical protein